MRGRRAPRLAVLVMVATAVLGGSAPPASASVSSYTVTYHSGRLGICQLGTCTNIDEPGSSVPGCPASTTMTGTVDDAGGTDTISGDLSVSLPFTFGWAGGPYLLTLTGVATGSYSGNYSGGATGTFSNLSFPNPSFNVKTLNPTTCAAGAQVCGLSGAPSTTDGIVTLTAAGGVATGSTIPLSGRFTFDELDGERIFVNAAGSLVSAGCTPGSVLTFVFRSGATLGLGDNPDDCYLDGSAPPLCLADPGAIFTQIP